MKNTPQEAVMKMLLSALYVDGPENFATSENTMMIQIKLPEQAQSQLERMTLLLSKILRASQAELETTVFSYLIIMGLGQMAKDVFNSDIEELLEALLDEL